MWSIGSLNVYVYVVHSPNTMYRVLKQFYGATQQEQLPPAARAEVLKFAVQATAHSVSHTLYESSVTVILVLSFSWFFLEENRQEDEDDPY